MRKFRDLRSRGLSDSELPLLQYFLFAGGALLVLLLAVGASSSRRSGDDGIASSAERPVIRIYSERKAPEPVVFDTTQQALPIPKPGAAAPLPATAMQPPPPPTVTVAQLVPTDPKLAASSVKKPRQQVKRRIARARVRQPFAMVAQRPYFWSYNMAW